MKLLANLVLSIGMLFSLTACGQGPDTVELNITGADYAGTGIRAFRVRNPDIPEAYGDGGSMAPYGAGGIRCCYEVPKQWHEGLMVEVETYYPLVGDTIEERSEDLGQREATGTVTEKVKLPVPEYQAPAAGTLWVQFMPDRNIKVVVSDLSPDHEDFPGDVKGWPVPSDEYRRQKIDQKINFLENSKKNQQEDLNELKRNPDTVLKSYWNIFSDIKHMSKEINIFSDYQDPRFNDFMKSYLKAGIAGDDRKIDIYKRSRP